VRAGRAAFLRGLAAAAIGAILLTGCGGGESEAEQKKNEAQVESAVREARVKSLLKVKAAEDRRREEHPNQVLAPAKFRGVLATRYETDREICSAIPAPEAAESLGLDGGADPEEIADAYGKQFSGRFREAASEGCLAGFESQS
jgi:hypothetical protein